MDNVIRGEGVQQCDNRQRCNSALFPFPSDTGALGKFANLRFTWSVSQSKGTGDVHSSVLKIKCVISFECRMTLNGKEPPFQILFLHFHLGKAATMLLCNHKPCHQQLDDGCKEALNGFLT